MRTIAGAVVIGLALRLPLADPDSIQTVAQSDAYHSYMDASTAAVSADGRFVAFTSYAQLAPADTDHQRDIYVLERAEGRVTLESDGRDGRASAADVAHPGITGDGRFLVYETSFFSSDAGPTGNERVEGATRLDEPSERSLRLDERGEGPPRLEIVLRDRFEAVTRILSVGPAGEPANGTSRDPSISRDGRFIVFVSTATNLVQGPDANGAGEDIYLVEMRTGAIRRVSLNSGGLQPSAGSSITPSVSADGRYVAFASTAALDTPAASLNFIRGPYPGGGSVRQRALSQVYVRDTALNTTRRVSVGSRGSPDGESWRPVISADGRYIAFVSAATNLAADDRNGSADVFLADLQTGLIELVSLRARGGSGNGASGGPALSEDGRFLAFQSEASNFLLCGPPSLARMLASFGEPRPSAAAPRGGGRCSAPTEDINLLWDVFLFDRQTRVMTRLSADAKGGWMEGSTGPALDATGEIVAFSSRHPIDATDTKNDFDLFVVHRF